MNNTKRETVEFNLSINQTGFSVKGPIDWVDEKISTMLAKAAFSLDQQPRRTLPEGSTAFEPLDDSEPAPHLRRWMLRHAITWEELSRVVHIESGRAEVVANRLPGNGKEKLVAAYLLEGFAHYAVNETARFDDKSARELLVKYGAYDKNNHAAYLKALQGKMIGNKNEGWALSVPGQGDAAKLVKSLASDGVTR